MAVGDLIAGPTYPQYEWAMANIGSLLMGSGTNWIVEKVSGLLGIPDLRTTDIERQGASGDYPGRNYYKARRVAMDLIIREDTVAAIETDINSVGSWFQTADIPTQLVFQRTGQSKRFLWAVVERADFDSNYDVAHRMFRGSVQWKCADPKIYSLVETATPIVLGNTILSNSGNVTNAGNVENAPWFSISGPCTNPRIAIVNAGSIYNGRSIKIDVVIATGHTMTIDTKAMTAMMDGTSYPFRSDNQWFKIPSGTSTLTFSRSVSAASSTLTTNSRDAWI